MERDYKKKIGATTYIMTDANTIEVWGYDTEFPESYIHLNDDTVLTMKDFEKEISFHFMENSN